MSVVMCIAVILSYSETGLHDKVSIINSNTGKNDTNNKVLMVSQFLCSMASL